MKYINLTVGAVSLIGAIVLLIKGETTNGLLLLILAKLYTDGCSEI